MSVVIIGGNECMVRQYKDICSMYKCKAKIYPKMTSGLKNIGSPDLLVLFTNTAALLYRLFNIAVEVNEPSFLSADFSHLSLCHYKTIIYTFFSHKLVV